MDKKLGALTAAAAVAGAGAAVVLAKKGGGGKKAAEKSGPETCAPASYRNTELGKHEKNRKGIYYTNGNYEAFARPEKPEGVENKSAYIVGSGLAALAAACFLVRDGQMPGDHIHILEAMDVAGGACDGIFDPSRGYVMRGGREMEDHFECLWDLFRSIPSLEKPGASVLDEFYWLNKHDPNYSLCRATVDRGRDARTDGKFNLSQKGCMEIMKLFMTPDEDLYDKTIEDVFDDEVFSSTFWLYWRTMFAFENWHSALEMKLYFQRFIHHIAGLPDFSALKFTRYNQYESLILPMQKYLEAAGVDFRFGTEVTNVIFDIRDGRKTATAIECRVNGAEQGIVLTENDLVFVTNGSCTEGTIYGDQDHAPNGDAEVRTSGCWSLWKNIAKQDPAFGRPEKFCSDISKTNWESATITTLDDKILPYITNICKRDPRTGKVVTGGIVSCQDSKWLLSWTINRQGQFKEQEPERGVRLGVRPLYRRARRLCEKAHEGVYREGDHPGVALPHRRAGGADPGPGRPQRRVRAHHDALHHRLFHAPDQGRPARCDPRRLCELRLPGPVRRYPPGHRVHHRVLRAHRHGGRLRPAGGGPGRARGVGQRVRHPGAAAQHRLPDGRQVPAGCLAARSSGTAEKAAAEGGPGHRHREGPAGSGRAPGQHVTVGFCHSAS